LANCWPNLRAHGSAVILRDYPSRCANDRIASPSHLGDWVSLGADRGEAVELFHCVSQMRSKLVDGAFSAASWRSDPFGNALHHHALDPEIAVRRHPLAGVGAFGDLAAPHHHQLLPRRVLERKRSDIFMSALAGSGAFRFMPENIFLGYLARPHGLLARRLPL